MLYIDKSTLVPSSVLLLGMNAFICCWLISAKMFVYRYALLGISALLYRMFFIDIIMVALSSPPLNLFSSLPARHQTVFVPIRFFFQTNTPSNIPGARLLRSRRTLSRNDNGGGKQYMDS